MNRIAKILTMAGVAWVTALLAAGCTKEGRPATGWEADPDAVRIEASVGTVTKTNPLGNDDEQTKFSNGDKIAVAAVDNGAVEKTVKYQFDGSSSWTPVADEAGATGYLVWDTPVTFRAWYPASASWDEFTLPQDQSGANGSSLADADFMTWSDEYGEDAAIPEGRKLSIEMTRRMALVTIVIDKVEDQYDYIKNPQFETVKISSAHTSVKIQSDGTFAPEGDPCGIYAVKHVVDGKPAYSAIVTPGEAKNDVRFLFFYIGNGKDCIDHQVTGVPAAEAGKHYTYKLIVGKQTVKIGGVTVEDWTKGTLDDKFEAEVDDYSEWDGKKASSGYTFSGSGSETAPYLIKSAADLADLAANVNSGTNYHGKYFKLEANIDLMGHEWTPIGTRGNSFYGNFDGDGKVITNLTISNATDCAGLFGFADGTIQNIVLRNASVTSSSTAALLVGGSEGGVIKSCNVDGTVRSSHDNAAGIVGRSSEVEISDCEVNVECYGYNATGGVFGSKDNDSGDVVVKNCTVRGRIFGKTVGGIAGMLQGSDVISGCKSYATLSQFDKKNYTTAGGIAGEAYYKCKFEDCEVYGNIDIECENDSEYFPLSVGGAIGRAGEVTISNLKFEGTMNVKSIKEEKGVGAVIGVVEKSLKVSSECTYKKSGTGTFPPVGTCPEGVDISKITGI